MIRARDSLLLAQTKLRTRRLRLTILLVTMSVLFAGLVFIANVLNGTVQSAKSFSKEGFGNKFYVQARPLTYLSFGDDALVEQLRPAQAQLLAEKTALAKKLNITYDAKSDQDLYYLEQQVGPSPSDTKPVLSTSPRALDALNKQNQAIPGISFESFSTAAKKAGATATYRSSGMGMYGPAASPSGSLSVLPDGKENYTTTGKSAFGGPPTGIASLQSLGWNQMSDELLKPFLLPKQTNAVGPDGSIPIVAPFSAAEQILGLHKLPATASSKQKLDRLVTVRRHIATKVADLCYRSNASQDLLQKAIQQQADIAANKKKTDYTMPHLLYNLPSQACGATTIKSDKRTAEEKTAENHQQQFHDAFTPADPETQGIIKLRIIGVTPDVDYGGSSLSASGILSSVLSSSVGSGWYSPASAFTPGSLATTAQNGTLDEQPLAAQNYYAMFPTLAKEKAFITRMDCHNTSSSQAFQNFNPSKDVTDCAAKGKPFSISPYGSNAGAVADFQHNAWKILRFVLLGVVIVAVIVMMGTFGKVIADSRRETAVFRSLGATRFDICQIYLTYTVMVALIVVVLALVVGTIGSTILNSRMSPGLSVSAVLAFNAHDEHKQFIISNLNMLYLLAITGLVVSSGLISACVPLLMNLRRNPIKDMRDE